MLMQTVYESERVIGSTEASKFEPQKLIGVKRSDGIIFPVKIFTKVFIVTRSRCQGVTSHWVCPGTLLNSTVPINSGAFIA